MCLNQTAYKSRSIMYTLLRQVIFLLLFFIRLSKKPREILGTLCFMIPFVNKGLIL